MTTPARTRLVWKTAEIKRTVASLAAFGLIATVTAVTSWGLMVVGVGLLRGMGF